MQQKSSDPRVDAMYAGDCRWSWLALAVLWASYVFVIWKIQEYAGASDVTIALLASAGLVLLFNTASILAMISHYAEDKERIYGLDIHYLDANKKNRG